jgi:Tle cognate immunity protein 4 C-terminal domain/Tle cognate immunity protein 4 N-terminal domain
MSRLHCTTQSLALVATLALGACQPKPLPMTEQEAQRVQQFTIQMSPRCVGRYIIDLPKAFVLNSESSATLDEVKIKVLPQDRFAFDWFFDKRKEVLEKTMLPGTERNRPHLRAVVPLPSTNIGAVFDRSETTAESDRLSRTLELISWKDGYRIEAHIKATDTTFPEDANDSIAKQLRTDVPEKLATLLKVFERVRGRAVTEIPTEQGLCFANGFVRGAPTDTEAVQMAFDLAGTPDVYFNFFTQTEVRETESMLQRSSEIESGMSTSDTKTIRKGKRQILDLPYEEWLMSGPTTDRVPGAMFTLHGNETKTSPETPMIRVSLYNGFRIAVPERTLEEKAQLVDLKRASLSEAEAIAIWDTVTATLRPWRASR